MAYNSSSNYRNVNTNRSRGYQSSRSFNGRRPSYVRPNNNINKERYIKRASQVVTSDYQAKHSFIDFKLNKVLEINLNKLGFKTPSPIQDQTIPVGLSGQDVLGIANTGTGKTAAFLVPVLNKLLGETTSRAIILAPTRELAEQIEQAARSLIQGSFIKTALLIGGNNIGPQFRDLERRPALIIGTPGRIKDHLKRRSLNLAKFNVVVLDEVDRMLDMGFVDDIKEIMLTTSPSRQTFCFSATLDTRVKNIISSLTNNPIEISVKQLETGANIDQDVIEYKSSDDKIQLLHSLLQKDHLTKVLLFDDTKRNVDKLTEELQAKGLLVAAIHGGKSQSQRTKILKRFKNNELKILVATDVAARGLDVADISHVINYSTPQSYQDYVHRIGRTGRAGKTGYALTFIKV